MWMSDDALIRLENLRALNISATDLVKSVGSSYQYWRDLMAGNKSFGEKAARRIEEGVGLPRGSLDDPMTARVSGNTVKYSSEPARPVITGSPSDPVCINVNRRAQADAQSVVDALGLLLSDMSPARAKTVSGLLADFVQSPGDAWITGMLVKALEPEAFTPKIQNYG